MGGSGRGAAEALTEPGLTFTGEKITPSELRLFRGPRVRHEWKRSIPWEPPGCARCSRVSSLQGLLMPRLTSSPLNVSYAHLRMQPAAFASSLLFFCCPRLSPGSAVTRPGTGVGHRCAGIARGGARPG